MCIRLGFLFSRLAYKNLNSIKSFFFSYSYQMRENRMASAAIVDNDACKHVFAAKTSFTVDFCREKSFRGLCASRMGRARAASANGLRPSRQQQRSTISSERHVRL